MTREEVLNEALEMLNLKTDTGEVYYSQYGQHSYFGDGPYLFIRAKNCQLYIGFNQYGNWTGHISDNGHKIHLLNAIQSKKLYRAYLTQYCA